MAAAMNDEARLIFALRNLSPSDWEIFERFASQFLIGDFPDLRAIGGVGDRGRDAILTSEPATVVQISIAEQWRSKILATVKRLREAEVQFSTLIYVTNRRIVPQADGLVAELRREQIQLDVRDAQYFLQRVAVSPETRAATRELCRIVVDPKLPLRDVVSSSPLSTTELREGLLYLELLTRDTEATRNQTRLLYESIVLNVLAAAERDQPLSSQQITEEVRRRFPGHDALSISNHVSTALTRLCVQKRATCERQAYALHYSERERLAESAVALLEERDRTRTEISLSIRRREADLDLRLKANECLPFIDLVERLIETLLERQGNEFASGICAHMTTLSPIDLYQAATRLVRQNQVGLREALDIKSVDLQDLAELATDVVQDIVTAPGETMQLRLRRLADSYTLLAFMQQTPDVRHVIARLFSRGKLVLDSSLLLRVFPETRLDESDRQFTNLLRAAGSAGMDLCATRGVINEIVTHLQKGILFDTLGSSWVGREPFVHQKWAATHSAGSYAGFLDDFIGKHPAADLVAFLKDYLGIGILDLTSLRGAFDPDLVTMLTDIWTEHKLWQLTPQSDEGNFALRIGHDVEQFVAVLTLRGSESPDIYGHEAWMVTDDKTAAGMLESAAKHGLALPSNPAMSPNFLSNLLSFGPSRTTIDPQIRRLMPTALEIIDNGWGLPDLSRAAEAIRRECHGRPEYYIRRRLREAVDKFKAEVAPLDEDVWAPIRPGDEDRIPPL